MSRSPRLLTLLVAATAVTAVVPHAVAAAPPRMIRDLPPGPDGLPDTNTYILGTLGSRIVFRTEADPNVGNELYVTDGTRRGTRLLRDINVGAGDSEAGIPFEVVGGRAYFTATDATHGHELWRTDGTRGGTRLVKDLSPDPADYAYLWGRLGRQLVVQQSDGDAPGDHGYELWRSDGTGPGTKRMTDVMAGSVDSLFGGVIALGTTLLFISNDGTSGLELFRSSGTPASTRIVKDINEEPGGILPYPGGGVTPVRWKGLVWFAANDGTSGDPDDHGMELWRSDGTARGTRMLKDLTPGTGSTTVTWLQPLGRRLLFRAEGPVGGGEVWATDGTARGTLRLKDLWPGPSSSQPFVIGVVGGIAFISADGGPGVGRELWRTDGTRRGTRFVKDIASGDRSSDPFDAAVLGGRLWFAATDAKGRELWVSDGTARGTRRVSDINPGKGDAQVRLVTSVGKRLVFLADDGKHGLAPWTYVP